MDVLERTLSYDEVTEIFVRVNSLGAKLSSSLEIFQAYQVDCCKIGFELDLGIHLKNLVADAYIPDLIATNGKQPYPHRSSPAHAGTLPGFSGRTAAADC